jgi:hypothetical protein
VNINDALETEQLPPNLPILPSYDAVLPVVNRAITSDPSVSTFDTGK